MNKPLHLKYRPQTLFEVLGQPHIQNIPDLLTQGVHSFLFHGSSGTGKTTISRIIGKILQIVDVQEIDAAIYTGVDDMRELISQVSFRSLRGTGEKLLILDECHMLSKSAWNSILKFLEEPPSHAYICLCTTELNKVPTTIKTRCATYQLNELSDDELLILLDSVATQEEITLTKEIVDTILEWSNGSARQALVLLEQCKDSDSFAASFKPNDVVLNSIDLCKALIKRREISHVATILKDLKGANLFSVRLEITNYLTGCVLRANDRNEAVKFLSILECFDRPIENFSTLVLCTYEALLK